MRTPEEIYRHWLSLFDAGKLEEALKLTVPSFEMVTPDGQRLSQSETLALSRKMSAAFAQRQLTRSTEVLSLHVMNIAPGWYAVHVQLMLSLTDAQGAVTQRRIGDVLYIGPEGVTSNVVTRLSESQSIL